MNDKMGNAETRYSYDDLGYVIRTEMFDAAGAPINLKTEAWQRQTSRYDDRGNLVGEAVWMADGSPGKRVDCHRLRYSYYERGNIVRLACLDQLG